MNFGIGEIGSFVGSRYFRSLRQSSSIGSGNTNPWNEFRSTFSGIGFKRSGQLAMNKMYWRRNSLLFPVYESVARLRSRLSSSVSTIGRVLRRYMHIQGHHLINQATLTGKNPHPLVQAALDLGVDIRKAKWNLKTMFHTGGHTDEYYDAVRGRLDPVLSKYIKDGGNWSRETMESELREVAKGIRKDIFWLRLKLY
jgi:hypothetical protein